MQVGCHKRDEIYKRETMDVTPQILGVFFFFSISIAIENPCRAPTSCRDNPVRARNALSNVCPGIVLVRAQSVVTACPGLVVQTLSQPDD